MLKDSIGAPNNILKIKLFLVNCLRPPPPTIFKQESYLLRRQGVLKPVFFIGFGRPFDIRFFWQKKIAGQAVLRCPGIVDILSEFGEVVWSSVRVSATPRGGRDRWNEWGEMERCSRKCWRRPDKQVFVVLPNFRFSACFKIWFDTIREFNGFQNFSFCVNLKLWK